MYLDSSAALSVLLSEPDGDMFIKRIGAADRCLTSVGTMFEMILVLGKETGDRENAPRQVMELLRALRVEIVPVDVAAIPYFVDAFRQYHRGRGARAKLNFGDCITYAVAKQHGVGILYKGNDFAHTDLA